MCGIVGVVFRDANQSVDLERLTAARDALAHRGPDAAGLWSMPGVGLGHRRLSILDLSDAPGHGQQPIADPAGQAAMTYNGEVYNYRELMDRYAQRGHSFQSACDTELVFHALRTDGPEALDQFNGMFALAFYHAAQRNLLLVRDRMGQKPLYYYDTGEALVFASELKAILTYTGGRYPLDPAAVEQFFTRGYILSPRTIFQGIHKLPAGCTLKLDANSWTHQVESWYDPSPQDLGELSDEGVVDQLDELLSQSVRERMVSDVPLGTLLSGGIDSSLITAMAAKASDQPIKAFTLGFTDENAFNEMPYAEMVAKQYGCDWLPRKVDQGNTDWLSELEDAAEFYDDPFGNFTVTAQRTLSQCCRESLTVVLTGQGGDELSAGYPGRYNWVLQTEQAASGTSKRSAYAPPVDDVVHHLNHSAFLPWRGLREGMFSDDAKHAMIEAGSPVDPIAPFWQRHGWHDRLGNVLYTDAKTNLPDYLVCIEERASMSHSLEARNPMLDHRVVEFMLSLPAKYKVRPGDGAMAKDGLQNKWALYELAKRYLPSEAFDRPKRGFTPPLQRWMAQYAERIAEVFRETQTLTDAWYSPQWRQYLLAGRYDPQAMMAVYYSLVFALWAKRYDLHIAHGSAPAPRSGAAIDPAFSGRHEVPRAHAHATFREQAPDALATARWFCQALGNFAPGSTLQITGDPEGHYASLAERSGYQITRGADIPVCHSAQPNSHPLEKTSGLRPAADKNVCPTSEIAHILIGFDAIASFVASDTADAQTILSFIPFNTSDQARAHEALKALNAIRPIQGHQAVQVAESSAVLIARCAARETSGVGM